MISLIFWCLAAACCAGMDTLQHHFYSSKIYYMRRKPTQSYWWNPTYSWYNKYKGRNPQKGKIKWFWGLMDKPAFLTDGWHLFKSLMIVFICLSIAFADGIYSNPKWYSYIVIVVMFGTVWNLTFNLFYNHILIRKK